MILDLQTISDTAKIVGGFSGGALGAFFFLRRFKFDALQYANERADSYKLTIGEKEELLVRRDAQIITLQSENTRYKTLVDLTPILHAIREDKSEAAQRTDAAVQKLEVTITKAQQENVKGFREITKVLNEISTRLKPAKRRRLK